MCRRFSRIARLFIVAALFAALGSTGFVLRLSAAERDPALIAYLQAGGTLDALCGGFDRSSQGALKPCEACRLVSAAVLPDLVQAGMPAALQLPLVLRPDTRKRPGGRRAERAHPARAPPFL